VRFEDLSFDFCFFLC